MKLMAPFPYFGGKSRIAPLVWDLLGDVPNFVEPFAGSAAVLLARPHRGKTETINDLDGTICNFWRAVKAESDAVASFADWPVNEIDFYARHKWLIERKPLLVSALREDPEYYDVKYAGWWVWGIGLWLGGGYCEKPYNKIPYLGQGGMGVHAKLMRVTSCAEATDVILARMRALADRLRRVRVCNGDWSRVCTNAVTVGPHGLTGVFFDPPYSADRDKDCYSVDDGNASGEVLEWCKLNGGNPLFRIVLCGHEGEHNALEDLGWGKIPWKAAGGYGRNVLAGRGRDNAGKERLWYSPHCLPLGENVS